MLSCPATVGPLRQVRKIQASPTHKHRMDNIPDIKAYLKGTAIKPRKGAPSMVSEVQDPLSANGDDYHQHPLTMQPELTGRSFFIETYGCQMNVSDTEIVHAVLEGAGLVAAASPEEANVVLVNTCAVRSRLSVLHFKFQHPSKAKSRFPPAPRRCARTPRTRSGSGCAPSTPPSAAAAAPAGRRSACWAAWRSASRCSPAAASLPSSLLAAASSPPCSC